MNFFRNKFTTRLGFKYDCDYSFTSDIMEITSANFEKEVMNSDKPVLLDFWAEWCMPCRLMEPVFEELSNEFAGKVKFGKVNVDTEGSLANRFGITGIPTLLMIKNGKIVDRIVGFSPKEILRYRIERVLREENEE